jgi:hypothetical protein
MADTGTATVTYGEVSGSQVRQVDIAWTCDAGGLVEKSGIILNGTLLKLETFPGAGGTAPTDLYDITLEHGTPALDVLAAVGADRSATLAQQAQILGGATAVQAAATYGTYIFKVANAGISKSGTTTIFYKGG